MQFTLFSADCIGKAANCSYPHKVLVDDAMTMEGAVAHDHVCATYKNNYRNIANFQMSDVVPMDIDNDHSDNPADWITEDKMDELFGSIDYVLVPRIVCEKINSESCTNFIALYDIINNTFDVNILNYNVGTFDKGEKISYNIIPNSNFEKLKKGLKCTFDAIIGLYMKARLYL